MNWSSNSVPRANLWVAGGFFLVAGLVFVPLAGVEIDEALFSAPLYEPTYEWGALIFKGWKLPLFLINYLGALKTWVYWVIFKLAKPSVWSLRVPMLAAGVLTLWLFWRLAARLGGVRAAAIGTLLLATDALFLLTTVYDWGPVALQHLLLVGGLVLALRFHDTGSRRALFGAFLLFGLGVWDKALFVWVLGGLVAASLVVVPGELRRALRWSRVWVAGLAFCLGAWPVIYYNVASQGDTLRSNARLTLRELAPKSVFLWHGLAGRGLLGYLVGEAWMERPRAPKTALQKVSVWVSEHAGEPRSSAFAYLTLVAALGVPLVWRTRARRPAVFCLVLFTVAWFQMAITERAGGGIHHVVLLWPVPHLLVAVVFAELSRCGSRAGAAAAALAAALGCGSNLLLVNQHHSQLVRFGAPSIWSDAIFGLTSRLERLHADLKADHIFMMDWGLIDNVRMLSRGSLPIHSGQDAVDNEPPSKANQDLFRQMIALDKSVFVSFIDKWAPVKGVNYRLADLAAESGHRIETVYIINDRNGRPVFRIARIPTI